MAISKKEFTQYIREFKFKELFNDMGWEKDKTNQNVIVDNIAYPLQGIAEKRGFKILICQPASGVIPEYAIRKKIETKVTKLFQEHLIIYIDAKKQEQVWQMVVRQIGKPTKVSETTYRTPQDPELLYQRASGIIFELDEEEKITIVDVTQRITENFQQNNERVTKQFYDKFSKEHNSFLKFIKGIEENVNKDWYASLMLNRLMFCYFIQKKGFLDGNKDYLRDKLKTSQEKKGKNKFYSFYRSFLLTLFHQGLGAPDHSKELRDEIGKVPYLNGGLFEEHELEAVNPKIDIDDKAFERIFNFFDQYEWHLDTRHTASGKDINPDVIGYIFEKYINDRAQMGAYYTKEDITDYISKNIVLPFLFDETRREYSKAFTPDGEIWQMVKISGHKYIYDDVKHGIAETLPKEINKGLKDVFARTDWNKTAPAEFALSTETWREVVDRRNRYAIAKSRVENGELNSLTDFITYNLNISQFVQDIVENTSDADFLKAFYKALNNITIIDPTCGSGAFLFAAMNILEPLYEACIMRMRAFVEDEDRVNKEEKSNFRNKHKFFREVLENIQSPQHPNRQYFIYKSIILRNLYGVDIMKEAVEIAKLRLFLKLVATVEADYRKPNLGLEPLPDIDFNIRAGNTLIGFASEAELKKGLTYTLDGVMAQPVIEEKCDVVAKAYSRYKEIQLTHGDDYKQFKKAKEELNKRLKELNHELNQLFYKQTPAIKYDKWLLTHQPFHWFAEFYEIIHDKGGFDVIIGNPPYVEYKDVKQTYILRNYFTEKCSNLFSYVLERCINISHPNSLMGMIIPLSAFSTDRMTPLIRLLKKTSSDLYISNFSWRPGRLFDGANLQLSIVLMKTGKSHSTIQSTRYLMWPSEARDSLFSKIEYSVAKDERLEGCIPKLGSAMASSILTKLRTKTKEIGTCFAKQSSNLVYYRRGGLYWKVFVDFKTGSSEEKIIRVLPDVDKYLIIAGLSSNLWWWYFTITSDCRHLGNRDIETFPFDPREMSLSLQKDLSKLGKEYVRDLKRNAENTVRVYKKKNSVDVLSFKVNQSKSIIDQIDQTLAKYFGLTNEELDFIVNYDIKYRMSRELEDEED